MQHALLSVALAPAADVGGAWSRHRSAIPFEMPDTLEWSTRRLIPLVAWRLREAGVDDPGSEALRTDLAASMVTVRARLERFAQVLSTFERAGVDALVLKGVGIGPLAYPDPGTRPVSDLDVLVHGNRHGGHADYGVLALGLRPQHPHGADASIAGAAVGVDWRLLADRYLGEPDAALVARARPVCVGHHEAATLAVEDHVVHAIAQGLRADGAAPVQWIADVARLAECHPVEWSLVEERAGRRGLADVVGPALAFVHRTYAVPVPPETIRALGRTGMRRRIRSRHST